MSGKTLLRKYLKNRKRTDLTREGGFDRGSISHWLAGTRKPGLATALRLEEVTGGAVPASAWVGRRRAA